MTHTHFPGARFPFGLVLRINVKLLLGTLLGYGAYACWPSTAEWWHLGVLSLFMAVGGLDQIVAALRLMAKFSARNKAIVAMNTGYAAPKSAQLASDDALKQAGVIDE